MDYHLTQEFRERLIERYDGVSIAEILNLSVEDIWEAFHERCMENSELIAETGIFITDDDQGH
jgi:hypothetical protein